MASSRDSTIATFVAFCFCFLLCLSGSTRAAEFRFVGGCFVEVDNDFSVASNWSPVGVPGASDSVIFDGKYCNATLSISKSFHSVRVENGTHLIIGPGVALTVATSIDVSSDGALSMRGLNSEIRVGSILNVTSGVLSGSGSIYGTVHCGMFCEIDVLTYLSDQMDFVGNLTIFGDLHMYENPNWVAEAPVQPPVGATDAKKRGASKGQPLTPLPHAVIAIGATADDYGNLRSNLTVTGKMFIQKMSLSVLIYPNASSMLSSSANMIFASGGIVYLPVTNTTGRINVITPRIEATQNYLPPPHNWGIHTGRQAPASFTLGQAAQPGDGGVTSQPGCGSGSDFSIGILFGSTTNCQDCPAGFVWSDVASMCILTCADPTCSNHGICKIGVIAYCDCDVGWTGGQCQQPDCFRVNGDVCNLKGTCTAPVSPGQLGVCQCLPDWDIQPDCSVLNSTTGTSSDVYCGANNATKCGPVVTACTADSSACACPSNWSGTTCETPVCPNDCSGKGVCKGDRVDPYCECTSPATGADCSSAGTTATAPDSTAAVSSLPTNTIIGIAVGSSLGFVAVVAGAAILFVKFNTRAKNAVRPFANRQTTANNDEDL